jgi:hypothetical protein
MFIGHFAVAFGAKRWAPAVSLGLLFFAAQFADLLWPNLVLLGIERVELKPGITAVTPLDFISYPYSHSLAALILWGAIFAFVNRSVRKSGWLAPAVLMIAVVSHWILDFATHRPDMPLTFSGTTKVGLGMWYSLPLTLGIELAMFALGLALYAKTTSAVDRKGKFGFITLAAFLLVLYLLNLFGPPPPSVTAVAWSGEAMWLLVLWAWWADRHRAPMKTKRT